MNLPPDNFALLTRMEDACRQTQSHLHLVERQIAIRAERMAITFRAKGRQFGQGRSTWTNADERVFRNNVATLTFARRADIEALNRKLSRQERAIADFRRRLGLELSDGA